MKITRNEKVRFDELYQDFIMRLIQAKSKFNNKSYFDDNGEVCDGIGVKTVTFQVTESCNLQCTYCYQINKSSERLDIQKAKDFIDYLIKESYNEESTFHWFKTPGLIIEFIGGEPLLELDLIDEIFDYFRNRLIEEHHPWAVFSMMSMISNGVKYMDDRTQEFLNKNNQLLSFGVSLDGCKDLHDACRVFPDGRGSYDLAEAACIHHLKTFNPHMFTKMTLAPENIEYTFKAIKNLIDLGYRYIHGNCVYEDVWDKDKHPIIFYNQLKLLADYIFENDLEDKVGTSLFDEGQFDKYAETDDNNYCGSSCCMVAINNDGKIYPCIRFMKSSLGNDIEPYSIGTIKDGINCKEDGCDKRFEELFALRRSTQSPQKCLDCPIAMGCGWCTGYNYQITGTPNQRVITICEMHQARSLANVYFWNKYYQKTNECNVFKMNIPKEWALEIIDEEEYNMLLELVKQTEERTNTK